MLIHFQIPSSYLSQKLQHVLQHAQASEQLPTLVPVTHRHPGPARPRSEIPAEEWPVVLRRVVENQEPLRKVATDYGVSHETIRRTVRAARQRGKAG